MSKSQLFAPAQRVAIEAIVDARVNARFSRRLSGLVHTSGGALIRSLEKTIDSRLAMKFRDAANMLVNATKLEEDRNDASPRPRKPRRA